MLTPIIGFRPLNSSSMQYFITHMAAGRIQAEINAQLFHSMFACFKQIGLKIHFRLTVTVIQKLALVFTSSANKAIPLGASLTFIIAS